MATSKHTAEAPAGAGEVAELPRVDEAIVVVERLYQAITGSPPPAAPAEEPHTPIPVEKDAAEFVTERLDRLIDAIDAFGALAQPLAPGRRTPARPGESGQHGRQGQPGQPGQPLQATGLQTPQQPSQQDQLGQTVWSPPVTVWEEGDGLTIQLDVPGVRRQDLRLTDDGESLTVSGQRTAEDGGKRLRMTERPLGRFWRRLILPRGTGGGEVSARLHDGVLEVRIPKPKEGAAGPRAIPIS